MTNNGNNSTSGYDVQVVGDFLPQLNCGICMMIIKNAMNGCNKHVFCEACIKKHVQSGIQIDGNVMCPGGCGKVINPTKLEPNEFVDRLVNCLTTKCDNHGCYWQGDLLDLVQVHQTNCEFLLQSCVNNGCHEKYLEKDNLQHGEACRFKLVGCTYCHTDIMRMNMEAHVVDCLNEQVKCLYYDIGCKNELCRRDINSHGETHQARHMELIYQDSLITKNQVTSLKQENIAIKQENETLKNKLIELDTKSTQLALEVKTKDLKKCMQESSNLIGKKRKLEINAANEVKIVCVKSNEDVNNIIRLKHRLSVSSLREKILLINDDKVMMIICNSNMFIYADLLSKCYKENDFQYVLDNFGLNDHKYLTMQLLSKVTYHMYDYTFKGRQLYVFVFPLDLQNMKDFEISITGIFRMKISNNEILVEMIHQAIDTCYVLRIDKFRKRLKPGQQYNLKQQFSGLEPHSSEFAPGYAYIRLNVLQ